MPPIEGYSLVCQVPGESTGTVRAYTGTDLRQVLAVSLGPTMPEGHYGWMQQTGELQVRVGDATQVAFADFGPNWARLQKATRSAPLSNGATSTPPPGVLDEKLIAKMKTDRLTLLPPLLMEFGAYCTLLREARDVFVDGHFCACVAMCGISFERFQRDKARPFGANDRHKMPTIRRTLRTNKVLAPGSLALCEKMANLRNQYAHGHGQHSEADAVRALEWMHRFIDDETTLMRDYEIVNGILHRRDGTGHIRGE